MNHNNFSDSERPSVKIISIKNPVYIKVVEIGGFAFEALKKIFENPNLTRNEFRAVFVKGLKGKHLGNSDEDDQIVIALTVEFEGKYFCLDCVFNIETPNKEIEENKVELKNHGYPMPFYILNLQDVSCFS